MTWFKVDDGLHKHRKRIRAGISIDGFAAIGLWAVAGSWSSDELTDGWIPDDVVDYLAPGIGKELALRLEAAGLWTRVTRDGEEGWQFHQWSDRNPLRDQVLAEREAAARRQALVRNPELREFVRARDCGRCRYCGKEVRWSDRRGPLGGTFDHVDPDGSNVAENLVVACRGCGSAKGYRTPDQAKMQVIPLERIQNVSRYEPRSDLDSSSPPTRPDPTYKETPLAAQEAPPNEDTSTDAPPVEAVPAKPARRRATRLPEDFRVTPEMVTWAGKRASHVDGRAETEKFCNYWYAKSGKDATKLDWEKTWKNWMLSAEERAARFPSNGAGYRGQVTESNAPKRIPAQDRCPTHTSYPAATCGPCRADRLAEA